ncbi:Ppi1, partial [Drosophila busckii]
GKKGQGSKFDNYRCITANMICMKLDMPGRDFDECPNQLCIKANICKQCKPVMNWDRINVNCLPAEASCQFSMPQECLEQSLDNGIDLSIIYMKKEIGHGCYILPEAVLLRIVNSFQEVVHTGNVMLTCKGCTVGMATVRLSMQMRCQTLPDVGSCGNCPCGSSDSSSDPCLAFRDLSDDSSAGRCCGGGSSSNSSNSCQEQVCALQLQLDLPPTFALQRPKGKLVDMAGPYAVYCCKQADDACLAMTAAPGPSAQFGASNKSHLGEGSTNRLCIQAPPPQLKKVQMKRGRTCPVCCEDVSWLPVIAACPHCGYKPVPECEERTYDEDATANEILLHHFEQSSDFNMGSMELCSGGAATAAATAPSDARTSDAFEHIVRDYKTLKRSITKTKEQPAQTAPANKSEPKSAADKTAQLVCIFEELRKMFELNDENAEAKAKIQEICAEACQLVKDSKPHSRHLKKTQQQHCVEPKRPRKPKRRKPPMKSRLYTKLDVNLRDEDTPRMNKHDKCYEVPHSVPAHMGWLWTEFPLAQIRGWRPGAIRRSIRELMSYFLKDFPLDTIPVSKYMSYIKQNRPPKGPPPENLEGVQQQPTLHIEKKNDEYIITLRPLKDAATLARSANPYANMKPVQFRIVKNPLLKQIRDLKRCLKNMGFSKCKCHKPVMDCYCRSFIDKKRLISAMQQECQRRQLPCCEEELVLSDTSDSEAEYDFGVTPPAGLVHPERLKTTHVTNTETQYDENDWAMPTMYPHPPNAQVQYGGCVIGERQQRFNWIFGKGFVHAKPKPPKMRNMPKPKPKPKP